jgi:hypothetical protein
LLHRLIKQNGIVRPQLFIAKHGIAVEVDVIKTLVSDDLDVFDVYCAVWVEDADDIRVVIEDNVILHILKVRYVVVWKVRRAWNVGWLVLPLIRPWLVDQ